MNETYERIAELMFEATLSEEKKKGTIRNFPGHRPVSAVAIAAEIARLRKKKAAEIKARRVNVGKRSKRTYGGEAPTGEDYSVGI